MIVLPSISSCRQWRDSTQSLRERRPDQGAGPHVDVTPVTLMVPLPVRSSDNVKLVDTKSLTVTV